MNASQDPYHDVRPAFDKALDAAFAIRHVWLPDAFMDACGLDAARVPEVLDQAMPARVAKVTLLDQPETTFGRQWLADRFAIGAQEGETLPPFEHACDARTWRDLGQAIKDANPSKMCEAYDVYGPLLVTVESDACVIGYDT